MNKQLTHGWIEAARCSVGVALAVGDGTNGLRGRHAEIQLTDAEAAEVGAKVVALSGHRGRRIVVGYVVRRPDKDGRWRYLGISYERFDDPDGVSAVAFSRGWAGRQGSAIRLPRRKARAIAKLLRSTVYPECRAVPLVRYL